jgi:hypothetical protein
MKTTMSEILKKEFDYKANLIGERTDEGGWTHDAWLIHINGETVEYKTGTGHRKEIRGFGGRRFKAVAPKIDDVLSALVIDGGAMSEAFSDWCDNYGYDTDSRKALATYEACQENGIKLRRIGVNIDDAMEAFQDY